MTLEDALKISAVELRLTPAEPLYVPKERIPKAFRAYLDADREKKTRQRFARIIVAASYNSFYIAWKNGGEIITRNPHVYDQNFCQHVYNKFDWEPYYENE